MKSPHELPHLASYAYYRDWMREEDHRIYDDKVKLEEAYKSYRLSFHYKANQALFSEIRASSWCKEKYGTHEDDVQERKKLKERGRQGKVEAFLAALEGGEFDDLSFDQKSILNYGRILLIDHD